MVIDVLPLNVTYFKKDKNIIFKKKTNKRLHSSRQNKKKVIENKELMFYEKLLFPKISYL
jgi:hypothetical protein